MASNADTRNIVEITVAETMNQLEHDYGVEELESFGTPTAQEIAALVVRRHFPYAVEEAAAQREP